MKQIKQHPGSIRLDAALGWGHCAPPIVEKGLSMSTTDKIIAFIALLGLVVFNSVILIWVAEPDLIILVSIALMLAAYDFWRSVFRQPRE